jgi:hypothetical protein
MRNKRAKQLRKQARLETIGKDKDLTRKVYRLLKKAYKTK